jgi:hypothetical protein
MQGLGVTLISFFSAKMQLIMMETNKVIITIKNNLNFTLKVLMAVGDLRRGPTCRNFEFLGKDWPGRKSRQKFIDKDSNFGI